MTLVVRATPGNSRPPRRSQNTLAKNILHVLVFNDRLCRAHRVVNTGYSAISPVSSRASNRAWISNNRR